MIQINDYVFCDDADECEQFVGKIVKIHNDQEADLEFSTGVIMSPVEIKKCKVISKEIYDYCTKLEEALYKFNNYDLDL